MARLRQVAIARGALPLRSYEASSAEGGVPEVVQGLDLPVVLDQLGEAGGSGLPGGQTGDRVDGRDGGLAVLRSVRRRLTWMACRVPGKSRLFTVATLIRRISPRP